MSRSTLPYRPGNPQPSLSQGELAVVRGMLEQQRDFRIDQLAQLHADADGPLSSTDPEIYHSLVAGARAALRDVQAALWRIEEGRYGRCVRCAESIGIERLEILPQAGLCMACQRAADV